MHIHDDVYGKGKLLYFEYSKHSEILNMSFDVKDTSNPASHQRIVSSALFSSIQHITPTIQDESTQYVTVGNSIHICAIMKG